MEFVYSTNHAKINLINEQLPESQCFEQLTLVKIMVPKRVFDKNAIEEPFLVPQKNFQ